MLTLVFAELELPAVARKFEQHLSCPSPSGLSDVEYAQLDQDFKQLLEDQYKLYQNEDRNESRWWVKMQKKNYFGFNSQVNFFFDFMFIFFFI